MHEMQRPALCAAVQLFIAGYGALQRAQALHFLRRRNSVPMLSSGRARKVHGPKYQPVWFLEEVTASAAVPIDDIVPGRRRSLQDGSSVEVIVPAQNCGNKRQLTPPLLERRPPHRVAAIGSADEDTTTEGRRRELQSQTVQLFRTARRNAADD